MEPIGDNERWTFSYIYAKCVCLAIEYICISLTFITNLEKQYCTRMSVVFYLINFLNRLLVQSFQKVHSAYKTSLVIAVNSLKSLSGS